jgi:hypothetical protein
MAVFCNVVPCSMTDIDRRFRGAYCLHHQGDQSSYSSKLEPQISSTVTSNYYSQSDQRAAIDQNINM